MSSYTFIQRQNLSLFLSFIFLFSSQISNAQTVFLGHELMWVGSDTLFEALDGRPKFKMKVINRSDAITPDRVGMSFRSPDYPNPGGGFANFPNGGFIQLEPGDSMIVSVWSSGVFEHPRDDKNENGVFQREIGFRFLKDVFMEQDSAYVSRQMTFIEWPRPITAERIAGSKTVTVQLPSIQSTPIANESPDITISVRTPNSELITIAKRPTGVEHSVEFSLIPRDDWFLVVDAPGHFRKVQKIDVTDSTPIEVELRPIDDVIPAFQLKKVINTPVGFWRGAVSESEQTVALFPGQENFVQTQSIEDAAAIRASSVLYKVSFTGDIIWSHEADWEMWGGDMTPDGRWVAYVENPSFVMGARDRHRMVVLDGVTGEVYWDLTEEPFTPTGRRLESLSLKLSPDGRFIAVGASAFGKVSLYDREQKELVWEKPEGQGFGQIREMLFSNDNRYLYVGSGDSFLRKLNVETGEVIWKAFIGGWPFVNGLILSNDGQYLYTGTKSKDLTKVEEATGRVIWQKEVSNFDASESSDGMYIATFGGKVIDAENGDYQGTAGDRAVFLETSDFLIGIDRTVTTYDLGGRAWSQSELSGINECGGCQVQWGYISNDKRYVIAAARDMTNPSNIPGPGIAFYERVAGTYLSNESVRSELPDQMKLLPAYPNPFNPTTNIPFTLNRSANIKIDVYNLLGKKVATLAEGTFQAGHHVIPFLAEGLSSGVYFVKMTGFGRSDQYYQNQSMISVTLLK